MRDRETQRRWHYHAACGGLDQILELNAAGWNAFVGVNPRASISDGKRRNIVGVSALPLDIDTKKTGAQVDRIVAMLAQIGLPPNVVVNSGNGGHLYLLLDRFETPDTAEPVGKRLVQWTNTDHVWDATRVLRLPGTVNWKTPPTPCYLAHVDGNRYTLAAIVAALDAAGARPVDVIRYDRHALPASDGTAPLLPPGLRADIRRLIETGEVSERFPSGSEADWAVCGALMVAGASDGLIAAVYAHYNIRHVKADAAGSGYLERTIAKVRAEWQAWQEDTAPIRVPPPIWKKAKVGPRMMAAYARPGLKN